MPIHFTTEEESERLLNAGLPANTADCYYGMKSINPSEDGKKYFPREIIVRQTEEQLRPDMFETTVGKLCLPCWSVGRLLEIINKCTYRPTPEFEGEDGTYIECLVWIICYRISWNSLEPKTDPKFDFLKLENLK